ncbi:hypothetical protein HAX54_050757, partial [Datura stramonium]|nr:hypothetical protein [Datura stramonium]
AIFPHLPCVFLLSPPLNQRLFFGPHDPLPHPKSKRHTESSPSVFSRPPPKTIGPLLPSSSLPFSHIRDGCGGHPLRRDRTVVPPKHQPTGRPGRHSLFPPSLHLLQ